MADTGTHMSSSKKKNSVKLKYTTFIPNDHVKTTKNGESDISLQEAFKKYRKAKQKQLKHARRLRRRNELRKADPKVTAALRRKFIQQAKKYFGYPYAKKYWPPDSPEYRSNLFLDCCGLVRQVMRDLADDFGFMIGPWNQAYMFDTLPNSIREEDMRPGDLVFVSATYNSPKSKKQPHNMTHVEIWLGDGPKTIGARWNNGKVQVFDSYRFAAKSYYDETYHFKSIDTWLKGICRSYCSQHMWKKRKFNPRKKSIFNLDQQQSSNSSQNNQQDQAAGDDEDSITNFIIRGNSFCSDNNLPPKKGSKGPKKKNKNQDQKSGSSSSMNTDSPELDDTDLLVDQGAEGLEEGEDGDDDMCDADNSDLESTSDDLDENEMDFIDAGDEEDDDEIGQDMGPGDQNPEVEDKEGVVDAENDLPKSGKLVDLDNRGIYLKDLMKNGETNSPASVEDLAEVKNSKGDGATPNAEMNPDDCVICRPDGGTDANDKITAHENKNPENQSISIEINTDIAKNVEQMSIQESPVDALNEMKDVDNDATQIKPENLLNTNQNASPQLEQEKAVERCPGPVSASRLSLHSSSSDSGNASSSGGGRKSAQSTGSEVSIAGAQSTVSIVSVQDSKGGC